MRRIFRMNQTSAKRAVSPGPDLEAMPLEELRALAREKGQPALSARWKRETLIGKLKGL